MGGWGHGGMGCGDGARDRSAICNPPRSLPTERRGAAGTQSVPLRHRASDGWRGNLRLPEAMTAGTRRLRADATACQGSVPLRPEGRPSARPRCRSRARDPTPTGRAASPFAAGTVSRASVFHGSRFTDYVSSTGHRSPSPPLPSASSVVKVLSFVTAGCAPDVAGQRARRACPSGTERAMAGGATSGCPKR